MVKKARPPNPVTYTGATVNAIINKIAKPAILKALGEIEVKLVSDAQALCPVYNPFKEGVPGKKRSRKTTGDSAYLAAKTSQSGRKITGEGRRILVNRRLGSALSKKHGGQDYVIGYLGYKSLHSGYLKKLPGEKRVFFGHLGEEVQTPIGRAANRSGRGTRLVRAKGYRLNQALDQRLTSRGRYNLARGIGVHKIGAGSYSQRDAGSIVIGGALRDSIEGHIERTDTGYRLRVTAGNEQVDYADYVEYGTYKDHAQPFMRPALKNSKGYINTIMQTHLKAVGLNTKG